MYRDGGTSHIMVKFHLKLTLLNMQTMNLRVKYHRTRSKFENLSRSAALTQFVKYISDETTRNHSINSPKHPKALENYARDECTCENLKTMPEMNVLVKTQEI